MAKRMVAMGDSIYAGVSGSGGSVTGDKRIPNMIANELGWSCDNEAVSGSTLAGKGGGDFLQMVQRLNFKNYDVCLLEYGVNDFDWTWEGLSELPAALDKGVEKIRGDNPDIMIFYQLPTPTWKHVDSLDKEDGNGWTQNDIDTGEETENVHLWLPQRLIIDAVYTSKLNENFEKCNKILDQLEKNMKTQV